MSVSIKLVNEATGPIPDPVVLKYGVPAELAKLYFTEEKVEGVPLKDATLVSDFVSELESKLSCQVLSLSFK